MKFKKKPVVIDAIQWNGKNTADVMTFLNDDRSLESEYHMAPGCWMKQEAHSNDTAFTWYLMLMTLEGEHAASVGDWIVRGVKGQYYPMKPDIFAASYEAV